MAASSDRMRIDLRDVQKPRRARRWRALLDRFYCQSDYSIPSDFQNGWMEGSHLDGLGVGRFASDPIAGMRTRSILARNPVDAYVVVLADTCPITMTQGGRATQVRRRGFAFISTMEPSSFYQLDAGAHQALMIPGELMRRFAPRIDDHVANPFGHAPLHEIFVTTATEWSHKAHAMNSASCSLVGTSIVDLLGLAIDGADQASDESTVRLANHRKIERLIEESYADPALDLAFIAKRMNLSARKVRSVLAAQGTSLSRLIRERRVTEALQLFRFGAPPRLSARAVAQAVGYADVRQFYKDMERIGGHRPSQLEGRSDPH